MPQPPRSTARARHRAIILRKEPTPAEARLWSRLRNDQLGINFRRQHAIGPYITDFCSPGSKLVIEVDGSQHLDQKEYDSERTAFLAEKGYRVLRFWNSDVMNRIDSVMGVILEAIGNESG